MHLKYKIRSEMPC